MENQFIAGKYAKGKIKENRNLLIKLCKLRDLLITNTILKQKTSQQTTRTLPLPPKLPCKNPYQNQIDHINPYRNQIYHILVKASSNLKIFGVKIFDSNSFNIKFKSFFFYNDDVYKK